VKLGNLGSALRLTPGREPDAKRALERAVSMMRERLQQNPSDAESWARMAGWLANLGETHEALAAIRRALTCGGDDVHTMVRAGHVYLQTGDRDSALQWIKRAIQAGYGTRAIIRSPEMATLLDDPELKTLLQDHLKPSGRERPDEREDGP
jgi:tetratricopeptide (TPR) repeat protein